MTNPAPRPARTRRPPDTLSPDLARAFEQVLADTRVLAQVQDAAVARALLQRFLGELAANTGRIVTLLDRASSLREAVRGSGGTTVQRTELEENERERRRLAERRRRLGPPIVILCRRWATPYEATAASVLGLAESILATPAAARTAQRAQARALRFLGVAHREVCKSQRALVGDTGPAAAPRWVPDHIRRLAASVPARQRGVAFLGWADTLEAQRELFEWPDFWLSEGIHASPVFPPRLRDPGARVPAAGQSLVGFAARLSADLDIALTADALVQASVREWEPLLAASPAEPGEEYARWAAYLRSPAGGESPLGRLFAESVAMGVAAARRDAEAAAAALQQERAGRLAAEKRHEAVIAELRAGIAEARAGAGAETAQAGPDFLLLQAVVDVLAELQRVPSPPERLAAKAALLQRVAHIRPIGAAGDQLVDPLPEQFELIGDPASDPPAGRVVRPAWVYDGDGGTVVLVKGAVMLG